MNLKDYREQPDEGLFEKIAHRVRRRRMLRRAGATAAVVAVIAVLCVVMWPEGKKNEGAELAQQLPSGTTGPQEQPENAEGGQPAQVPTAQASQDAVKEPAATVAPGNSMVTPPAVAKSNGTDGEGEADLTTLVPNFSHVTAADLSVPTAPQQELKYWRGCINDGSRRVEVEKVDADNKSHATTPHASDAAKTGEPPLHEDNLFWAPNVIVPSGDVEANRTFGMKFTSPVSQFQIHIYNRGGREVYHSSDPSFSWDGTAKGTPVTQGAYIWVVKFRDSDGKPREGGGTVTVIR